MAETLHLNEVEEQRAKEFKSHHCGDIYYKVYLTGIGSKIVICCAGCKLEEDITDYDCW